MSKADDTEWMEGPTRIPVVGLTKRELADALGYALKRIDKLVREGMPCRSTGKRGGLLFDLPDVIEWLCARRAAELGGDGDTLEGVKRRNMEAQARERELKNAVREGELIRVEAVAAYRARRAAHWAQAVKNLPTQVTGLAPEQQAQLYGLAAFRN